MFAEALQKGLATGGWVIGLMVSLGGFLVIVGLIGYLLSVAMGGEEAEEAEEKEDESDE